MKVLCCGIRGKQLTDRQTTLLLWFDTSRQIITHCRSAHHNAKAQLKQVGPSGETSISNFTAMFGYRFTEDYAQICPVKQSHAQAIKVGVNYNSVN